MENKKTEVDIILPNYNSADFIDRTIKSVLNQSYTKWRLILVDDFSNTETKNKIKRYEKFKKIKIYWLKKNKGAAYCRNFAIKNSNSNYIAFLDSDDIWGKNKLKEQIKFMKKNNYCFTCTNYKTIGLKQKVITPPKKISFNKFIKNTSIATSTMIVKRKISKGVRFIDTKICEDYFFKCQILKKIKFAYCLNRYLTEYTIRKDSLQSNKIRNFYWIWKINTKYNKLNFYDNLISLISISLNSLKRYGFK
jgi:teichuronic acid biosynthesis glycosyltransferase TuaG